MDSKTNYIDLIRIGEIGLINVPRKEKTHALCLAAVNINGLDIYHVPKHFRSDAVHYSAVNQNYNALKFISLDCLLSNPGLVEYSVSRRGHLLKWLLENAPETITLTVCEKAVNSTGSMLRYVPKEFLNKDLIKKAFLNDSSSLNAIYLSNDAVVKEVIQDVIFDIPLKHLPDHLKTYEICVNQLKLQGRQLCYVPYRLIDENMIDQALTSNNWAIEHVPFTFKRAKSVINIIKNKLVPDNLYSHIVDEPEFV